MVMGIRRKKAVEWQLEKDAKKKLKSGEKLKVRLFEKTSEIY